MRHEIFSCGLNLNIVCRKCCKPTKTTEKTDWKYTSSFWKPLRCPHQMATQDDFVLEWLLKIKGNFDFQVTNLPFVSLSSKDLILITYSFNLLMKINAERDAGKEISLWVKINIKTLTLLLIIIKLQISLQVILKMETDFLNPTKTTVNYLHKTVQCSRK